MNITLSSYKGASSIGSLQALAQLPHALKNAYADVFRYFFRTDIAANHYGMVIFDVYQYHQKTGLRETIRNCYDGSAVYTLAEHPEMMTKILNAAWNKMYRLALFQDSGITYPWGCYYEDLGTTYRLLARCRKIAFLNEPLYDYLVDRPGNLTSQFSFSAYHG